MKVIITGANGFLGSWLTKALLKEGHDVYCLVRKNSDLSELQDVQPNYLFGDVTNKASLQKAFQGMDVVFHLAGLVAYKKSDRQKMDLVNVQGTQNVVDVIEELKIPKLIHISSVVAVGASMSPNEILDENSEYKIANLNLGYFETKKQAEEIVHQATLENRIHAVIVNPSTIYGYGDAKKGSRKMQVKVAQGKFPFYTSGGVNVVAVEDVVNGILSAWKIGKNGERYILAGENITIQQLFSLIAKSAGIQPPRYLLPNWLLFAIGYVNDFLEVFNVKGPISKENANTATMYHWFKNDKAKKELNFNPRPAEEAVKKSVDWMKKQGLIN